MIETGPVSWGAEKQSAATSSIIPITGPSGFRWRIHLLRGKLNPTHQVDLMPASAAGRVSSYH